MATTEVYMYKEYQLLDMVNINWASSQENLSSGFRQSEFQTSFLSYKD